ncbi:MAG: hypothetical protein FJ304_08235 [Planctomycetes bacterium]|nr:hypothetical protein [Planctomycetota bacterium]
MTLFRAKAIGLGLALAAGARLAGGADWGAPGAPPLLPPAVRAPADPGPVWLPARETPLAPAGGFAEPFVPSVVPAAGDVRGPRGGTFSAGPLPAIPALPEMTPPPPLARPKVQPDPVPPPRPVEPTPAPPMMMPPHAPEFLPPPPLPQPRPVDPQPLPEPRTKPSEPELQPAPAELMFPAGVLTRDKHAAFGSLPIRLSRDYPPARDLVHTGHGHDGLTIADDENPLNRLFVRGEYLLWWLPGFATPVLATTNADPARNGYLGEPGTTAIVGPGPFIESTRAGSRLRAGFDNIEAGFFFLGTRSATAVVDSDRFPTITRPVFVPNVVPATGQPLGENGEAVALPGVLRGTLTATGDSRLWGADLALRRCLVSGCDVKAEWFAGYRHLNLRERLTITEDITVIGPGGTRVELTDPVGTRVLVQDRFAVRNEFHGAQVGALYERRWGNWDVDARAGLSLGVTHQVLEIDGAQVRQRPGMAPMNFRGGLNAAGPNLGRFTRDRFSVAPELTLNVGYRVAPNLRVFAGYNLLLWTNVIRPGDQIDHVVDLTFVPNALPANFSGTYRPRPLFTQRDLVVNGLQFGLDWRW